MSTNTLYLGYHVSSAGGYMAMGKRAAALGANTFAFFTRNPRGGAAAKVEEADVAAFRAWAAEQGFGPLVAHSPYTLNPCSDKPSVRDFAKRAFTEDLERMELTPGCFYNFHPGSHVGQGTEAGIEMIAELLNAVLSPDMHTTVLLETMAGKGSEIGGSLRSCARSSTAWSLKTSSASVSTRATSGTAATISSPTRTRCLPSLTA